MEVAAIAHTKTKRHHKSKSKLKPVAEEPAAPTTHEEIKQVAPPPRLPPVPKQAFAAPSNNSSSKPAARCCPTCGRAWPAEEARHHKQPPVAPSDLIQWACPYLPVHLLQPIKKRDDQYFPFVSGQNSSAPTMFSVVGTLDDAAQCDQPEQTTGDDDETQTQTRP